MNRSINKLLNIMDKIEKDVYGVTLVSVLRDNNLENVINNYKRSEALNRTFTIIKTCIKNENGTDFFQSFDELSLLLRIDSLTDKDVYNIVMYIVRNNVHVLNLKEYSTPVCYERMLSYEFKTISRRELKILIETNKLRDVLDGKYDGYEDFIKEYNEHVDEFSLNDEEIFAKYREILDLVESMQSKQDIDKILSILQDFGLDVFVLERLGNYLIIKLMNKVNKSKQKIIPLKKEEKVEQTKYLSDKESRDIRKHIYGYYNISKNEINKYPEDINVLIELLKEIELLGDIDSTKLILDTLKHFILNGYSFECEKTMLEFIKYMLKFNINENIYVEFLKKCFRRNISNNPIIDYLNEVERITYYDRELAEVLDSYFIELLVSTGEDYVEIKDIIEKEIKRINAIDNYEYEIEKIRGVKQNG